jgi:MOSC domain-containing protein YiiM
LKFPDVELTITQDAPPCKTIKDSFISGQFSVISHKKQPNFTRWYAKVTQAGTIYLDDSIEMVN